MGYHCHMKVTTKTETSVFIKSLNQSEITEALAAAGLTATDDFDIRHGSSLEMQVFDGVPTPVSVNGFELVHCSIEVTGAPEFPEPVEPEVPEPVIPPSDLPELPVDEPDEPVDEEQEQE
jgi:hypothetical protein